MPPQTVESPKPTQASTAVHLQATPHQRVVTLVVGILALAAVCGLLFGPGRGARNDLAEVRDDVDVTRQGIGETIEIGRTNLAKVTRQLRVTRTSLQVQQEGLRVASSGVRSTQVIEQRTTDALATLDRVLAALGPLRRLRGDVETVVSGVEAGVSLAEASLEVARATLADGEKALEVAVLTLSTLRRSEQVQRDLLVTARATLAELREVNRKIPLPPVFETRQ